MKFTAALALAVGSAQANTYQKTTNECWDDQGATHLGNCFDLFYRYCDEYEIGPGQTCNVHTFSRSTVKYLTSDMTSLYWKFIYPLNSIGGDGSDSSSSSSSSGGSDFDDFADFNAWDDFGEFKAKLRAHLPIEQPEEPRENPFDNGCIKENEIPKILTKGNAITLTANQCAIRYQIKNESEIGTYTFQVGRDSAVALSSAVAALYAVLAF